LNILSICPALPSLDAKGFQVQAYYRLKHLAKEHRVHVLCYGQGKADQVHKQSLLDIGISVDILPFPFHKVPFFLVKNIFWEGYPLQCVIYRSQRFRQSIRNCLRKYSIDLVHVTTIRVMSCMPASYAPLVLDLVDSMSLNFRRRVERSSWWQRPFWRFEFRRVAQYEREAANAALLSFIVSALDRDEIGLSSAHVLPLGIDTERYSPSGECGQPVVVFTGNMGYRPNVDAVLWLARVCWPEVISRFPSARLLIVGKNPVREVKSLAKDPSVFVTGYVESMADILRNAQVSVAPMQSGSGMQFKILEAMACGIPVVATKIGLGDIKAIVGQDILVSDSPKQFTDSIIALLSSKNLRDFVGKAGRQYVQNNHSWGVINERFESLVTDAINADA
jgi:polysaccharide biosynthesis protein PslH